MFFKRKNKNKEVVEVKSSRKIYLPIYLMALVLLSFLSYAYFSEKPINFIALIGVFLFVYFALKFSEIHRMRDVYAIEPPSLVHTHGIFNKVSKRLDFFAISDIDVTQNFWQRFLNVGDVNVRLFSKESNTAVKNINNPKKFAKFLEKSIFDTRRNINKEENLDNKNES